MNLNFFIPVHIISGQECVLKNSAYFSKYGNRAFIITGHNSGRISGALSDVINILNENNIKFDIYDAIENNPSLLNIQQASDKARIFKPDYIIGIGGGSPLDSAKAVSVMAANPELKPIELYNCKYDNIPLPIIAIPTTAGTGSEVTPYSILTRDDIETKKSFSTPDLFPKVAFLDGRYTQNLPYLVTVDTVIDAVCHAVEGYLSNSSSYFSDILAEQSMAIMGKCLKFLIDAKSGASLSVEIREKFLYASTIAGMVISHTGTTIIHSIGYSLTYFKGYSHGRANCILLIEYLKFNYLVASQKVDKIISLLGFDSINDFSDFIDEILENKPRITIDELELFIAISSKSANSLKNPRPVSNDDISQIITKSCILV